MERTSGRVAGRPRRLMMRTARRPSPASSSTRSGAGDGACAAAVDRHKQAKTRCPSAATCRRRKARASISSPGQASTAAKPPLASNCSTHQPTSRPARTMTRRSRATPAAAQAGACGNQGGATRASQPPAPEMAARAGSNRFISPRPPRSTRISVRFPRGQPPPGNSASSSAWPLGIALSGSEAGASPRQTSPLASTSAKATVNGMAFMRASLRLRGSGRRRCPRWRTRPRRA